MFEVSSVDATSTPQDMMQHCDVLQYIMSFVGPYQYRFVAPVSKAFQASYLKSFPNNKETYFSAFSIEHAIFCMLECPLQGQSFAATLCSSAARHGSLATLQHLRSLNFTWNRHTFSMAVKYGHAHIVQYLHENGCPRDEKACCYATAEYGHVAILQFAASKKYKSWMDSSMLTTAAEYGQIAILKWVHYRGLVGHWQVCMAAAKNGHLVLLQWLHANGYPWNTWTCSKAAKNGHLETLMWARENGCPWDSDTCSDAAANGHLPVLQWARKEGCPWNKWTCSNAARYGHLKILQWAHENGCPWDSCTCSSAARNGHSAIFRWAFENGCPSTYG
jgi:hypothetical protein